MLYHMNNTFRNTFLDICQCAFKKLAHLEKKMQFSERMLKIKVMLGRILLLTLLTLAVKI